jgi:electron transport complex protein RnfG
MANIIKSTLILATIAFIASMALSHINTITYPSILRQEKQKQDDALKTVLPGYTIVEQKRADSDGDTFMYWIGERVDGEKRVRGYAFLTEKSGYSGLVKSMIGVNERGIIIGISILQQTETPGLGARCTEIASKETFFGHLFGKTKVDEWESPPWFQEQFNGLDASRKIDILKRGDWTSKMREELIARNAISAITGATITSRTVRDSIERGMKRLRMVVELNAVEGK